MFNADKAKTDGLFIDKDNDNVVLKDELQKLIELPTDNPDEKYELYYKVIEKTLREKLPKGDEYKEGNHIVLVKKVIPVDENGNRIKYSSSDSNRHYNMCEHG